MTFTIALAQCKRPEDGDVLANVRRWVQQAADAEADLLVFPEALMTRFTGSVEEFAAKAEPIEGPFASAINALAKEFGLWIVYTMNERNPEGLPFNTALVTDSSGKQRGHYRKMHLFDLQGENESRYTTPGTAPMEVIAAPFARLGLGICYDLRFPELAEAAAQAGAQLMLYPSAWVAGPGKVHQWKTLLRERALENEIFVAGVSSVNPKRAGHSSIFAPDGTELATCGADEALVVCKLPTRQ